MYRRTTFPSIDDICEQTMPNIFDLMPIL